MYHQDKGAIALIDANGAGAADGKVPMQSHLHTAPASSSVSDQDLLLSIVNIFHS